MMSPSSAKFKIYRAASVFIHTNYFSFKKELLMPPKYTVENGKKKRMLIIYLEQNTASNLDNNCSRVVCFVFVIYLLLTTVNIGRTP